eukprot:scaffold4786_cov198-Amphora_coffeaeformis.AAC.21
MHDIDEPQQKHHLSTIGLDHFAHPLPSTSLPNDWLRQPKCYLSVRAARAKKLDMWVVQYCYGGTMTHSWRPRWEFVHSYVRKMRFCCFYFAIFGSSNEGLGILSRAPYKYVGMDTSELLVHRGNGKNGRQSRKEARARVHPQAP